MGNRSEELHRRCARKGFRPLHVAEVGVWDPRTSNVAAFADEGVRTTLVEPDPASVASIRARFAGARNVELHPVAVSDAGGPVELVQLAASSFVLGLPASPGQVNDGYEVRGEDLLRVDSRRFDEIDDGTIDLLVVDVEGSEWFVLKHMRSRPGVLALETHGRRYVNPFLAEMEQWLALHEYESWYVDKSNTVYVHGGLFPVTRGERFRRRCTEAALAWSRLRHGARRLRRHAVTS